MNANLFQQHKSHIDFLRIFCIFLVLFNHTKAWNYPFCHTISSIFDFFTLTISISIKVAVPIFFMISGALLLPKKESIQVIFKHRVLRFLVVILLYQILQHAYGYYVLGADTDIYRFSWHCIMGTGCGALNPTVWFLYAYLGFLLMLPVLRILAERMQNTHFLYLFSIQIILIAFIPEANTGWTNHLPLSNIVFLYPLVGYYVENRACINKITPKFLILLSVISLLCIFLGALMSEAGRALKGDSYISEYMLCIQGCLLIPCITFFFIIKKGAMEIKHPCCHHLLQVLGGAVFTVFLFENILRDMANYCIYGNNVHTYAGDIASTLVACCFGYPLGIILKRTPWIKKLL